MKKPKQSFQLRYKQKTQQLKWTYFTTLMTYKEQKHWLSSCEYSVQFAPRTAYFFVLVINRWWQKKELQSI